MTQRFGRGLVVGKFAPLHLGHEFLLDTAAAQCDQLYIVSYCHPEFAGCEPWRREQWLQERYPRATVLVATPERVAQWQAEGLSVPTMPRNNADDAAHRHFTAQLCLEVLRAHVDTVFSSENYGDGFAAVLSERFAAQGGGCVAHCLVDLDRRTVSVSGTALRADVHGLRRFLSPSVYAHFVQRIALLGAESTGKTTLSARLASEFGSAWVAEYGRELWEARGGVLRFEDYLHIAQTQIAREMVACGDAHRYLFCDTTPLTTLCYCHDQFAQVDAQLDALASRSYDAVFLCAPDFPLVQDGTRRDEAFRQWQHAWYQQALAARGVPFTLLTGSLAQRIEQVRAALNVVADTLVGHAMP